MKTKIILIIILILAALGVLYYYFDLGGVFCGIFGLVGGSGVALKKKQDQLEGLERAIEKEVDVIEKERAKLEKDGVEDKTDQEEVDYWKKH
jgi:hypothetical protein